MSCSRAAACLSSSSCSWPCVVGRNPGDAPCSCSASQSAALDRMPCRFCLVRRRRARYQGVIAENHRLEPLSALQGVPLCRVRPRRGRLPASHHTRQGVMRRVEVFEHLVHRGRGHGPVGVLLCGTHPARR